jgi:hypothetical protein
MPPSHKFTIAEAVSVSTGNVGYTGLPERFPAERCQKSTLQSQKQGRGIVGLRIAKGSIL